MAKIIRKCRLADSSHRNVDLRIYENIIIDTINKTVPRKNPAVYKDAFVTDKLNQSEAVALGRALAKIDELIDAGFSLWEIKDYIYYGMDGEM
ncbi:MAG: hypothetical protein IJD97_04915 [Clostridia bacterium]|nr:hypothetical protein [Clostridia bacterium]